MRIRLFAVLLLALVGSVAFAVAGDDHQAPSDEKSFETLWKKAEVNSVFQADMASIVKFVTLVDSLSAKNVTGYEIHFYPYEKADPKVGYFVECWLVDKFDPKAKITHPEDGDKEMYTSLAPPFYLVAKPATEKDIPRDGHLIPSDPKELQKILDSLVPAFTVTIERVKATKAWGMYARIVYVDAAHHVYKWSIARAFDQVGG